MFVRVSRATLKMATQMITQVTNLPERVCKKRNRDAGLVCVIINDGCFTGGFLDVTDATDATGVITEVELHDNFMIDLKHQISIVQGDDMPTSFYTNFYMRTMLVVHVAQNAWRINKCRLRVTWQRRA